MLLERDEKLTTPTRLPVKPKALPNTAPAARSRSMVAGVTRVLSFERQRARRSAPSATLPSVAITPPGAGKVPVSPLTANTAPAASKSFGLKLGARAPSFNRTPARAPSIGRTAGHAVGSAEPATRVITAGDDSALAAALGIKDGNYPIISHEVGDRGDDNGSGVGVGARYHHGRLPSATLPAAIERPQGLPHRTLGCVLESFTAETTVELSVARGEIIVLISNRAPEGWVWACSPLSAGLVPRDFVQTLDVPEIRPAPTRAPAVVRPGRPPISPQRARADASPSRAPAAVPPERVPERAPERVPERVHADASPSPPNGMTSAHAAVARAQSASRVSASTSTQPLVPSSPEAMARVRASKLARSGMASPPAIPQVAVTIPTRLSAPLQQPKGFVRDLTTGEWRMGEESAHESAPADEAAAAAKATAEEAAAMKAAEETAAEEAAALKVAQETAAEEAVAMKAAQEAAAAAAKAAEEAAARIAATEAAARAKAAEEAAAANKKAEDEEAAMAAEAAKAVREAAEARLAAKRAAAEKRAAEEAAAAEAAAMAAALKACKSI